MARRLPGLERVLDAPALFGVAYGEIGSSLFVALGVVSLYALGLTPWVLLAVGGVFLLVSLSYAEGVSAMPEPGGAAEFVRRAFNDPAAFVTGWLLLLDYVVVMALAALFAPHYLGHALGAEVLTDRPWDVVAGVGLLAGVASLRLARRVRAYMVAVAVAGLALAVELLVVVLGFATSFEPGRLADGVDVGTAPSWSSLLFALALATVAYTGLETVANYAAETREPGRVPRAGFLAVGLAVVVATLVGVVGVGVFPLEQAPAAPDGVASALATDWVRAPLVGIVTTFDAALPGAVVDGLRMLVGLAGVVVLVATVTTSLSGAGRLTSALARREMLPRTFARPARRSAVAPAAIVGAAAVAAALLIVSAEVGTPATALAGIYSFGVLMAFTAAQVAVVRLRMTEPDLPRPFRIRGNVRIRGRPVPLAPLVGAPITFLLWIATLVTHDAARAAGPAWLALGIVLYVATRHRERAGLLERVEPATPDLFPTPEGTYRHILVPLKLSVIGEEVLATAVKLAEENRARVDVVHVLRVPLERPLDEPLAEEAAAAEASIAEARELAAEHGVEVEGVVVRARSIGEAIVARAQSGGADLIVLGSSPRWRRQSRFLSPTVDHVLRHAHCEVMVVAYPDGVLEETGVQ